MFCWLMDFKDFPGIHAKHAHQLQERDLSVAYKTGKYEAVDTKNSMQGESEILDISTYSYEHRH